MEGEGGYERSQCDLASGTVVGMRMIVIMITMAMMMIMIMVLFV